MATDQVDLLIAGPTVRFTVPAGPGQIKIRITSNPSQRRRLDLRVITNSIRYKQGDKDVAVSNDTTNDNTNGELGRFVPTSQRWAIDTPGRVDTQYVAFIRDADDAATAVVELTLTDTTSDADLPALV